MGKNKAPKFIGQKPNMSNRRKQEKRILKNVEILRKLKVK